MDSKMPKPDRRLKEIIDILIFFSSWSVIGGPAWREVLVVYETTDFKKSISDVFVKWFVTQL